MPPVMTQRTKVQTNQSLTETRQNDLMFLEERKQQDGTRILSLQEVVLYSYYMKWVTTSWTYSIMLSVLTQRTEVQTNQSLNGTKLYNAS